MPTVKLQQYQKREYKLLKRVDYFPVSKALKVLNADLDPNLCLIALFKIYHPVHQFPNHQLESMIFANLCADPEQHFLMHNIIV